MDSGNRLREAIKQTQIVIEQTASEDIIDHLEAALSRLEYAVDALTPDGEN
jgi:predicted nucleotide-binding protein